MPKNRPVVLVVEDEALIRMSAADLVESAGCEAIEARDADEAIRILEARTDIRLVFTDVDMPGEMDGVTLTHYIRNRWPPIYLIVASGKALLDQSQLPTGAKFFPKPYGERTIVDAIVGLLAAQ